MHFFAFLFGQFKKKQYLCSRFSKKHVSLAQLVEQLTLNQWVESSSLSGDTKDTFECLFLFYICICQNFFVPLRPQRF